MSRSALRSTAQDPVGALHHALHTRLASGQRFAALLGRGNPAEGTELVALVARDDGITALNAPLPAGVTHYAALTPRLPAVFWYERAIHDLVGLVPDGHPRLDPLVLPHREDAGRLPYPGSAGQPDRIEPDERALSGHLHGTGVFTIPHGPVRSGVFESVEYLVETPGEDIPHLRIRPHAKHRGVQKRFEGMTVDDGVLLAERVEGIASVAHALAFAHAVETLAGARVPVAAVMIRVLHAELERIANHLDVLGKLTDAAGLAVATARFGLHKERTLRLVGALSGSRFGRGVVVPGGVTAPPRLPADQIIAELDRLQHPINGDMRAGVAVNVGFYGMWRTLELLRVPPGWLAVSILLLGGFTALLGIAHATVQTDLAEVVAYSSVENGGLISVGYGVALVGAVVDRPPLVAVGLLAATLQTVAYALAKSLLFSAVSGIQDATGTTELEALRGVGHRLPASGTGLVIGALTLAGLPLTAGFVSEWFLLESLMQQFRIGQLAYALPLAVAGALVAITVGFAAVAFVRIVGLIVLGSRQGADAIRDREVGPLGTAGLVLLGVGCLGVAAVAPLWIRVLIAGLDPVVGRDVAAGALKSEWVLQPVYSEFSALSPSWLVLVMPVLLVGVLGLSVVFGRGRMFAVRRVPAWRSATGGVAGENQYTPFGFANPTRKVLATLLLTRSELTVLERETGGRVGDPHRDAAGAHLGYTTDVVEVVERFLFRPLRRGLLRAVRTVKRLQNGRLDAYLGYMLIAVLAVLAVVAGLA